METNKTNKRIALIPAYKPSDTLVGLVEELDRRGFSTVVVDDGSGQEYDWIFEDCAFHAAVLTHRENKGKGAALKTGLRFIGRSCETPCTVVTLDADGQHSVDDAVKVCAMAERCLSALVLGCRSFKGEDVKVPKKSLLGNKLTRTVFRLSSGVDVSDTQTGLRAVPAQFLEQFTEIEGERSEYETNMLLQMKRLGIRFVEQPIETVYDKEEYSSHYNALKDSWRIFKVMARFMAHKR